MHPLIGPTNPDLWAWPRLIDAIRQESNTYCECVHGRDRGLNKLAKSKVKFLLIDHKNDAIYRYCLRCVALVGFTFFFLLAIFK